LTKYTEIVFDCSVVCSTISVATINIFVHRGQSCLQRTDVDNMCALNCSPPLLACYAGWNPFISCNCLLLIQFGLLVQLDTHGIHSNGKVYFCFLEIWWMGDQVQVQELF